MATVVKFACNGDLRRVRVPAVSMDTLQSAAREAFGQQLAHGFVLKYLDDEGDLCVLVPDTLPDLQHLMGGKSTLRLEVFPQAPAPAPVNQDMEMNSESPQQPQCSNQPLPQYVCATKIACSHFASAALSSPADSAMQWLGTMEAEIEPEAEAEVEVKVEAEEVPEEAPPPPPPPGPPPPPPRHDPPAGPAPPPRHDPPAGLTPSWANAAPSWPNATPSWPNADPGWQAAWNLGPNQQVHPEDVNKTKCVRWRWVGNCLSCGNSAVSEWGFGEVARLPGWSRQLNWCPTCMGNDLQQQQPPATATTTIVAYWDTIN